MQWPWSNLSGCRPASENKVVLWGMVSMFALLPVYIFPSGGVNVADFPIVLLMIYVLFSHTSREMIMQSETLICLCAFVLWAAYVNLLNYMNSSAILCIIAALQVVYTVALFVTMTVILHRVIRNLEAIRYIYISLLLSSLMPLVVKGLSLGFTTREGLSFPNPNQLAYFAQILIASIICLNHHAFQFHPNLRRSSLVRMTTISLLVLGHLYTLLSASRAGLAGVAFLDLVILWEWRKLFIACFAGLLVAAVALATMNAGDLSSTKMYKRMEAGAYYSGLAERTEGRFNFDDLSFLLGGGKVNRSLEDKKVRELKEVHNTLGDVVYSYGLIGGALFAAFMCFYFRACMVAILNLLILVSFLPLHISHNLIRFRPMWIFYALMYAASLAHIQSIAGSRHSSAVSAQILPPGRAPSKAFQR